MMETLISYLQGTREEIRKVSWPSRRETMRYSALVIGASLLVAAFFASIDTGFTKLVNLLITQRSVRALRQQPPTPQAPAPSIPSPSPTSETRTINPQFDITDVKTTEGSLKVTPIERAPIAPKNER